MLFAISLTKKNLPQRAADQKLNGYKGVEKIEIKMEIKIKV